jgi:hypothetical protein
MDDRMAPAIVDVNEDGDRNSPLGNRLIACADRTDFGG